MKLIQIQPEPLRYAKLRPFGVFLYRGLGLLFYQLVGSRKYCNATKSLGHVVVILHFLFG